MTDQDNLRDRIAAVVESYLPREHMGYGSGEYAADAIIDALHLGAYDFTRHDGHTTTHVHGWMERKQ